MTRELFKEIDARGQKVLRISLAEVTGNQAFSRFEGFDRVILPLEGPEMSLEVEGKTHALPALQPFAFPGEANVKSFLAGDGVALDLNLMVARGRYEPAIGHLQGPLDPQVIGDEAGTLRFAFALAPFRLADPSAIFLNRFDMIALDAGERLPWPPGVAGLLLEARPR